ncbi:hypothetical protein ACUXAV_005113 [Cupriavidus metallidurans]|uniref:hypothetical protein n=1 Tax=Cupriavidus metallidurans TaxID=119219 RepID=UPI00049312F3|nr:hypothetical protein [Cupriavidus metallidurans]MDE4917769.1 hypothetical protein [Cupriavidus metallidurans]
MIPAVVPDIAPMSDADLEKVRRLEGRVLALPQISLHTDHVLHGGMYARTICLAPDTVLTGALIKIPTVLIISGDVLVYTGDVMPRRVIGYHVLSAAAWRKQAFIAVAETHMTMVFPTQATTVEQAENEFTDEADRLMSRRQGLATKEQ